MKNQNEIYKFCIELANEWCKVPNLRFGQLVVNTLGENIFYIEDNEALNKIKKYLLKED